jgi:hypothetical protein
VACQCQKNKVSQTVSISIVNRIIQLFNDSMYLRTSGRNEIDIRRCIHLIIFERRWIDWFNNRRPIWFFWQFFHWCVFKSIQRKSETWSIALVSANSSNESTNRWSFWAEAAPRYICGYLPFSTILSLFGNGWVCQEPNKLLMPK